MEGWLIEPYTSLPLRPHQQHIHKWALGIADFETDYCCFPPTLSTG